MKAVCNVNPFMIEKIPAYIGSQVQTARSVDQHLPTERPVGATIS